MQKKEKKKNRGLGAVNQIQQLLDDLCLGDYHFEAANILRNSLLLSSLLSNSETWYDVTKKEISELESVNEGKFSLRTAKLPWNSSLQPGRECWI